MYDTDANVGYDVREKELRDRSRSLGKELRDVITEKERSRSPVLKSNNQLLGAVAPVPVLNNAATLPRNYTDSLKTEKRSIGPDYAMIDSKNKA